MRCKKQIVFVLSAVKVIGQLKGPVDFVDESAEQLFNNWDSFLEIEELAKAREKNVDDFINAHMLR